jgi:hypothetical protein
MAVIRWAVRKGAPAGSWLERVLARKPRMIVAIALSQRDGSVRLGDVDEEGGLSGYGDRSGLIGHLFIGCVGV